MVEVLSSIGQDVTEARKDLAIEHDRLARGLEKQIKGLWVQLADVCICVRDNQEWAILGFSSWNAWLLDACPSSRSLAYAAIGARDELKEIGKEELALMPLSSARTLAMVPKAKRTKTLLAEATGQRPKDFRAHCQERFPELHIETALPRKWMFEPSQERIIDGAIEMAKELYADCTSDESSLEYICAQFMLAHREGKS